MKNIDLTRRDFLKFSAAGICGLCLAGCSFSNSSISEEYYQTHRKKLLEDCDYILNASRTYISEKLPSQETETVVKEARSQYETLLPQVPDIGGEKNQLTETLYMSAVALALYQTMKAHGQPVEETGRVMYRVMEEMFTLEEPLKSTLSSDPTGKNEQESFREIERWTQQSTYPGDWKMKFINGDGENFDFGVDYTECGIVKFYKAHNAFELARYMCLGDFPMSQAIGSGLVRTTTLGSGGTRCDFRFKARRPIQMEWTPDFLK